MPDKEFFCSPFESTRRPKNDAEGLFFDLAEEDGWCLTKRGWPDFFLVKNGRVACVEVKPSKDHPLRKHQKIVMAALATHGIPCFVWSPDGGMVPVEGVGGSSCSSEDLETATALKGFGETLVAPGAEVPTGGVDPALLAEVESVWTTYIETMKPRQTLMGGEERQMILKALEVATSEEVRKAILGCGKSDFHQGKNDRGKKYNRLGQIIKGRKGKETTRERLDFFIDIYENAPGAGSGFPSAPADVINQKKRDVQRGHRFRDDPDKQQKAEEAERWLKEHGIKVVRGEDGYPTFDFDVTT